MALLDHAAATYRGAEGFIDSLCTPDHAIISARDLAIIVAHPDDETIGCGAQLRRFREATIVVVTDGAPRNCDDARRHRLSGVEAYAARRFGELRRALALADVSERNVIVLGISDQTAALRLAELTHAIYYLLVQRKIGVVLTHAYEGGHPDH